MPFTPWQPPEGDVRELRQVSRRIQALTVERPRKKERCATPRRADGRTKRHERSRVGRPRWSGRKEHHRSGRSIEGRARISKEGNMRIRRALFMPAQVAIQPEPNVGAFYDKLVRERGKPKMVAVMRKLLHAIYGMLKHDQDFQGEKFYRIPEKVPATA